MNKQNIKKFIEGWFLPSKVKVNTQIIREKIKNRLKYDQSLFEKNEKLKDIHSNDRCFLIATGPSLKEQDLTLLKDEITIGVSGLYTHKDLKVFMPKYYVSTPIFRYHGDLYDEETFIADLREMDKALSDETIMFFDIYDKPYIERNAVFKNKEIHWLQYIPWDEKPFTEIDLKNLPNIHLASEVMFYVALYLGFKEIYLLGIDHTWFSGLNRYFDQSRNDKFFKSGEVVASEQNFDSEFFMRTHTLVFKKYKTFYNLRKNIFNANADGSTYVDMFPKVVFESLFDTKKVY